MQENSAQVPRHVAIIMDGNGRWANQSHLPRIEGHRRGANSVKEAISGALESGVEYLTLYAFSVENWQRPEAEVNALMELLAQSLRDQAKELTKQNVRLRAIGRLKDLPPHAYEELNKSIGATQNNTQLNLTLALSYSSRVEITEAVQAIVRKAKDGSLNPENVDESTISQHLYTHELPDPDLLIRTSGEYRLSNFLLWQMSYAEMYITPVLWPDFKKQDFLDAVADYKKRHRRFGGV